MLAVGTTIRYRITDILAAHWEEFFQSWRGWIRPVVLETVRKLLACRTPALGCHVYECPEGHETRIVPHSCKSRFCPTCGKHATDVWADGALSDLLAVEYHHVVLSAPAQLRGIMAMNREVCLGVLARAAAACFNQWARDQHGMRMGLVTVIHTFGGDLKWHPHLHLLVTEGGLSLDGERWVSPVPVAPSARNRARPRARLMKPLPRSPPGASAGWPRAAPIRSAAPAALNPWCSSKSPSGRTLASRNSFVAQATRSNPAHPPSHSDREHEGPPLALQEGALHL